MIGINHNRKAVSGSVPLRSVDDLKEKHPKIHAAIFQAGVKAEKSRIMSLLDLATAGPSSKKVAMLGIIQGHTEAELEPQFLAARRMDREPADDIDTPPHVPTTMSATGSGETGEGEEPNKAQLDAFREKIRKIG